MGYKIQIPSQKDFKQWNGFPFQKLKRDADGDAVPKKDKTTGKLITNSEGGILADSENATFQEIAKDFLNDTFILAGAQSTPNAPIEKPEGSNPFTMEDITNSTDITRALNVAKDVLEIEDAPYEWLVGKDGQKGMIDLYGPHPRVLGMNARIFKEIFRLPPQPRENDSVTYIEPDRPERKRNDKKRG